MKLYQCKEAFLFTDNDLKDCKPILVGDFTDEEQKYCIGVENNIIIINIKRRDNDIKELRESSIKGNLIQTDIPIIRGLDELIDILVSKQIVKIEELSDDLKYKLEVRKKYRKDFTSKI